MLLKGGWHGTACVHACCSLQPFQLQTVFSSQKKSVFVCEIPLENREWVFIPRDRDVLGKLAVEGVGGKTKCMRTMRWQNLWKRDNQQSKAAEEAAPATAGTPPTPTTTTTTTTRRRWVEWWWYDYPWERDGWEDNSWERGGWEDNSWERGGWEDNSWERGGWGPYNREWGAGKGMGVGRRIHTHQAKKHKSHHHP